MSLIYKEWLPQVLEIALNAGEAISAIYSEKKYSIKSKSDNSPVTEADLAAHQIIEQGLRQIEPNIPILSEEGQSVPLEVRAKWPQYWLVDPLDGTKEFIQRTGEFTVNIALIRGNRPILGVVIAPLLQRCYWSLEGEKAFLKVGKAAPTPIYSHLDPKPPYKIAVSRHHHSKKSEWSALLKRIGEHELVYLGSALKICLVAEGSADLYPRFGATSEWDTAAGQCILEAAGGELIDFNGHPLVYNTRSGLINPFFYAICSRKLKNLCCG